MFKHILCPTDMKERSQLALTKAVQIAHQFGAKITLLNIHDEFMNKAERSTLRVSFDKLKEQYRRIAVQAREEMEAMACALHADEVELDYVLREGKPEKVIAKAAGDLGADLIVISADGRDNIKDFITCTITENVINHAPCSVLVIPCKLKS